MYMKIIEYILVGDGIKDGTSRCDGMEGVVNGKSETC